MNARHRHMSRIARRGQNCSLVTIPMFTQTVIPSPPIGTDNSIFGRDITDKLIELNARSIWDMTHPYPAESFRLLNLNSYYNDRFARTTPSFTTLFDSTNKGLINLYRSRQLTSLTTNHRYPISLEHRPCRTIADAERSLECLSRNTAFRSRKMPCSFKPSCQRRTRFVHDRTCRNRCLMATCCTDQATSRLTPRFPDGLAGWTAKTIMPPQLLQVGSTSILIRKFLNKFSKGTGKIFCSRHIVRRITNRITNHAGHDTTGGAN